MLPLKYYHQHNHWVPYQQRIIEIAKRFVKLCQEEIRYSFLKIRNGEVLV
jgi:hypothetical protein